MNEFNIQAKQGTIISFINRPSLKPLSRKLISFEKSIIILNLGILNLGILSR